MNSVEKPSESRATLALGLGIAGLVGALVIPSIGAVVGALAIVFGVMSRRQEAGRSKATTGLVLGAIAVVIGVVSTVLTATGHWG